MVPDPLNGGIDIPAFSLPHAQALNLFSFPRGERGVEVLRLAHAKDRGGVREIHRVVRALLHVQQAQAEPRRAGLQA
jgi:hypothetical protein